MTPKEILRAYSQQQATMEQVVRALLSYDGWLVEGIHAVDVTGRTRFAHGLSLGEPSDVPPDQLWFYTDEAAVNQAVAKGARLGTYVGGVPGTQLFAALPADRESVQINIGCAKEETWMMGRGSYDLVGVWARALALEARLLEPDSPEKFAALREHAGYLYFMFPDHDEIVKATGVSGLEKPGMIFTALDCAQEVSRRNPQLRQSTVGGEALFSWLRRGGPDGISVDGIIFNPFGPGPTVAYDLSVLDQILAAPAADKLPPPMP